MEPEINVGIVSGSELRLVLHHVYHCASTGIHAEGPQTFSLTPGGKIAWLGIEHDVVDLQPTARDCTFDVADVTIGVNFHWERRETQKFTGAAKIIVEGDKITLVNHLPLEDYLMSVISSEMSATANEEFLKAHAVISRSWIMPCHRPRNHTLVRPRRPRQFRRMRRRPLPALPGHNTPDHPHCPYSRRGNSRLGPYRRKWGSLRCAFLEMLRRRFRRVRKLLGAGSPQLSHGAARR